MRVAASIRGTAFALLALVPFAGPLALSRVASAEDEPEEAPPPEAPDPDDADGKRPGPATDDDEPAISASLDERTIAAVRKGVVWLRGRAADGWWGTLAGTDEETYAGTTDSYTGPYAATALALYTLLKCGTPPDDPLVKRGFAKLKAKRMEGHAYERSMKLLAITATADPFKRTKDASAAKTPLTGEMRAWAQDLVKALCASRAPDGWRYWGRDSDARSGGAQDVSSTQLATLALFAAERCGLKVDPAVWTGILRYTLSQQQDEGAEHPRAVHERLKKGAPTTGGSTAAPAPPAPANDRARGFSYMRESRTAAYSRSTGAMTACGIGCLMMARFALMTKAPTVWAKQDSKRIQQSVYDGLAWLDLSWNPKKNPNDERSWNLYYVYCVERAMDLVGGARIGKHVWYLDMAVPLLEQQHDKGYWDTDNGTKQSAVLDTCFALLFLRRATQGGIPYPSVTGGSDEEAVDNRGR